MRRKRKTTLPSSGEKIRIKRLPHDSERQYQLLFKLNPVPMFIFDENTFEFLDVNEAALRLYGYSRKVFLRMTAKDIRPPEDVPQFLRVLKGRRQSRATFVGEWRHVKRNGSVLDVAVTVISIPFAGRERRLVLVSDISDRKRAEAALRESEARYHALFEQAADAVVVFDPKTLTILDFNDEACRRLGYTREEFAKLKIPDFEMESIQEVKRHSQKVTINGAEVFETKHRTKAGAVLDIEIRARAIRLDGGIVVQGIWRDITERKRAEQSLQMFRYCLDHASVAIEWIDRDGKYTYVNEQTCRSLGYTAEELMQRRLWDIDPEYGKDRFLKEWQQYQENRRGGGVFVETVHRRKDGVLFPVEVSSKHLWFGDTELHVAFVHDITERKRAEAALQKISKMQSVILDNSTVGIAFVRNRVFEWVNPRMAELFGIPLEQLQGASTRIVYLNNEAYERLGDEGYPLLAQGKKATIEAEMRKGNGSSFWCRLQGNALDESKPQDGSIWIWEDITERKRAEEALRKMAADLEQRVQERTAELQRVNSSLLHEMAQRRELERQVLEISEREKQRIGEDLHDGLGQSLTGLGYLISAVQERLENKSAPEAAELGRITRLVEKTKHQIHDLAWGLFTKELRKGGIAAALKELAIETRDVIGISCRFTGPPAIRLANTNVANQVYRIAQEAVNNAAKHSKGKTIEIRLMRRRGRFVLTVRDTGIGISQTAGKAIGMGQRIMKYRAEMIGAILKIDATRGKGTTVTCVLPPRTARIWR